MKKKPFYIILLNTFVFYLIIRLTARIITRAGIVAIGYLLVYCNDLVSMIFLLIYLNVSIRIGSLLYIVSFICYLLIQFLFVQDNSTGIIVSIILRVVVVFCSVYSWRRDTIMRKKSKDIEQD